MPFALAVLTLALPAPAGNPPAVRPTLAHGAPFVGQVLTLELEGAAPSAPARLWYSAEADAYATPYGLLELRRDDLVLVTTGTTAADGTLAFDVPVPLDPALAEAGAHFQVLVADPSARGGKVLSDAVHARFLGPRVYAGYRGVRAASEPGAPVRTGLYVLSAVSDAVVARVDYGLSVEPQVPRGEGAPVFDASFARGAVMGSARELVVFDPFFGSVFGRVAFATDCSKKVLVDAAGRRACVLEPGGPGPARVHAIDLATAQVVDVLELPGPAEPTWCADGAGAEAYVAEHEADGRTALRRVALDPLADRGATPVGTANSRAFRDVAFAGGQVFASTLDPLTHPFYPRGNLTRCRPAAAGLRTRVTDVGFWQLRLLSPAPAVDRLLAVASATDLGFPLSALQEVPLATFAAPAAIPHPPAALDFLVSEVEIDGPLAWILYERELHHGHHLYRLDLATRAWTEGAYASPPTGYSDAEPLRDAWSHELWIASRGLGEPFHVAPEITIVDELRGTTRTVPLQHTAEVLHAVPLP